MNLLIFTQKIDNNDPVLGFFHVWTERFSKDFEKIIVVCLEEGEHNLPENVEVLSLGKENRKSRFKYIYRFYKYIWGRRNEYDGVFIHMNQEYMILGGLCWRILGRKSVLWYNHKHGTFLTRIAMLLANKILYTSPFAFTANSEKSERAPVGIDMEVFKHYDSVSREGNTIVTLGRISPVKNIDVLIDALRVLKEKSVSFTAKMYGSAPERDKDYENELREETKDMKEVVWEGSVSYNKATNIYNSATVYINMTPSGSFDKTIVEAMACETPVLICNSSLGEEFPKELIFMEGDAESLSERIEQIFSMNESIRSGIGTKLRSIVEQKYSLEALSKMLSQIYDN